ncbi:MAG: 30S ribosomal protein S3 [Candidatus Margulisiibacteriota bacterium]
MGQKANPKGLRVGITRSWECNWFAEKEYKDYIVEDFKIKAFVRAEFGRAGIASIQVSRKQNFTEVTVQVAKTGMIFGKSGKDMGVVKEALSQLINSKNVKLTITEEKHVDLSSKLLADWVAQQLEKRIPFRRAMKMAVQRALKAGAQGVKVCCAGRLGGAEIARTEWYREGKVPLHTLRADIDYAFSESLTTFGKIGVKFWLYKGEVMSLSHLDQQELVEAAS